MLGHRVRAWNLRDLPSNDAPKPMLEPMEATSQRPGMTPRNCHISGD
jgi:hypothetical protein